VGGDLGDLGELGKVVREQGGGQSDFDEHGGYVCWGCCWEGGNE
jgi:hypothetical protein